jgi:hypothetical protein
MTRICNFPISKTKRCKQPIADDKPNCGRHGTDLSADQLSQSPTVYQKDYQLHIWAGEPDDVYCLIHSDPAYQALYRVAGGIQPCCLGGSIEWKDENNWLHRDDGPALIKVDGTQEWYQHGELHREDGPAIVELDGWQSWYQHNKLHRDDGPAMVMNSGEQYWYRHGEPHRDDGPAVTYADGSQDWYQHGFRHRDDGPAMVWVSGEQRWFQHGKPHREDGPAWITPSGDQYWYWRGKAVTEEEHAKLREQSEGV